MAKRCVPNMRCGAEAPGWLKGDHPSEKEGIVNRTVCFHYGDDCCFWRSKVQVRNCSGLYVYRLKRVVQGAYEKYRYCGNGKGNCQIKVIFVNDLLVDLMSRRKDD